MHTHTHTHAQAISHTHCSDVFIAVQVQCYSAAFVASGVLSETVSEDVASEKFLIPPPCR